MSKVFKQKLKKKNNEDLGRGTPKDLKILNTHKL